jgi:sarcosine oxidase subunit gamma
MSERHSNSTRLRPQDVVASGAASGVTISNIEASTAYALRIAPAIAESIRHVAGFDLTGRINTAIATDEKTASRLGPDEWLLMAPAGDSDALTQAISAALDGQHHSLVDISHRNVSMVVAGVKAPIVLNAGVALDLEDAAFPAGSATRTVLGKAEIVLIRPSADRRYFVVCWRSFAPYVQGFLEVASRNVSDS